MKCDESLRFLSPYLDSELDPKTSFEIGRHLEECASCKARFEQEEALERKIEAALRPGEAASPADAAIWAKVDGTVRAEAARGEGRSGRGHRAKLLVALLLLAIVAGSVVAMRRTPCPFGLLGEGACHSHNGYLDGTEKPEVVTSKPDEIASFFSQGLGFSVRTPARLELTGARRCAFGPVRVAYLMGKVSGEPVSVFVFPTSELASFPDARAATERGGGLARAEGRGGREVVLARGDRVTACAFGAASTRDTLEALAREAAEASR